MSKSPFQTPRTRATRAALLTSRRALKMARSAHAYVRGNTAQFYDWLDTENGRRIPVGPEIWICGDCHVGNLGPLSDGDGNVDVQIRDLDQTVIGNPSHDIVRLGLSLAMASRSADLPGVTTALMLEAAMLGYRRALYSKADTDAPPVLACTYTSALRRRWRHLAEERLGDRRPSLPIGRSCWPLLKPERAAIESLFRDDALRGLFAPGRDARGPLVLIDAAYWVKGCSSLGGLRFVALAAGEGACADGARDDVRLIDIKQAGPAAAPRADGANMPRNNAERVVAGARRLSPHLGGRMVAAQLAETPVVVREVLPQDLKFDLSRMTADEAISAAKYLAHVVGRAHWRQMDAGTKRIWSSELTRAYTKTLDAPTWLWASVVDLVSRHEAGYLAHCRRYALGMPG